MSYSMSDPIGPEHTIWITDECICTECQLYGIHSAGQEVQKAVRYEEHGLPETVAVTRADEEREVFLLEIAHKGTGYELTREQAHALKECLRLALDQPP